MSLFIIVLLFLSLGDFEFARKLSMVTICREKQASLFHGLCDLRFGLGAVVSARNACNPSVAGVQGARRSGDFFGGAASGFSPA